MESFLPSLDIIFQALDIHQGHHLLRSTAKIPQINDAMFWSRFDRYIFAQPPHRLWYQILIDFGGFHLDV